MQTEADFLRSGIATFQARLSAITAPKVVALPGVNFAGGSWGSVGQPLGQGYCYPADSEFAYFAQRGFKLTRLAFLWERIQPTIKGEFASADLAEIDRCVAAAKKNGMMIVLDCHNYGKRQDQPTGHFGDVTELGNLWWRLSNRYKGQAHIAYGLCNEPQALPLAAWKAQVVESLKAIRFDNPTNPVMVAWGGWDGAHDFVSSGGAAAFAGLNDPNVMLEVHQYLDSDDSGTHLQQYVAGKGATVLGPVTDWARANGVKVFLGEFGFAMPAGETETRAMLQFMTANADVWTAYAVWMSGPLGWGADAFSVQPETGTEAPQIAVLRSYMAAN